MPGIMEFKLHQRDFLLLLLLLLLWFYFEIVEVKAVMKRMEVTLETDSAFGGKHELQFQ